MGWLALLLAVAALPLVVLYRPAGLACLAGSLALLALTAGDRRRLGRRRLHRVTLTLITAVAALAAWTIYDSYRPESTARPDESRYQRASPSTRQVLLPLRVEVAPITKLAIVPFDGMADPVYSGLEPQFIRRHHEQGYRVVAYRHDGHVDIYDDLSLTPTPEESSRVTGKGTHRYVHTDLHDTTIERDGQGRAHIAVRFTDIDGRDVRAEVREHTTRSSVPVTLHAPVGLGAVDPDSYPLFLLNRFDFVRTGGSTVEVTIDGRPVPVEPFPVPMPVQGQTRSGAKYTVNAEIMRVFPTDGQLRTVTLVDTDVYEADGVRYLFEGSGLARILVQRTEIVFDPPLDVGSPGDGRFDITAYPDRGSVGGTYHTDVEGPTSALTLGIDRVRVPRQRDPLYRLIVSERSVFATWPRAYRYEASIDLEGGAVRARWINERPGS